MNNLMHWPLRAAFLCLLSIIIYVSAIYAQTLHPVKTETGVGIVMRDGVRLSAHIFRPDIPGKFPALLMRTPYGKGGPNNAEGIFFAELGYAVIYQDTRGRFDSEGVFDAMQAEAPDGFDTQEWVGAQPWCNGKIGAFGGSYVGFTQWMPAPLGSKYLRTMFPLVTFSNLYESLYPGGVFSLRLMSMWSISVTAPYAFDARQMLAKLDSINFSLPLIDQDRLVGWRVPFLRDWIAHPANDLYWKRTRVEDYRAIKTSVYNLGGWFDLLLGGTLKNFTAMTSRDIPPEIRAKQKLLIGPWVHGLSQNGKVGELDFGKDAVMSGESLRNITLKWFDAELKGIDNGIWKEDPVRIFVMGENVWRSEKEWPVGRTEFTKYYFHSDGNAQSLNGTGSLNTALPAAEPADRYVYDPAHPVPTILPGFFDPFTCGPRDQREIEKRKDILVYSTPPLAKRVEVTGPVEVVLYAASSAVNTDFTAKLVDVYPDGRAIRLCDGIIRASHRESTVHPALIEPGKVYRYSVDLWATSNVFLEGHSIRLEISSSNFPRFDRNLNMGISCGKDTLFTAAEQAIFHDTERPSHILLPIIPRN